jgi:hypothetical protein
MKAQAKAQPERMPATDSLPVAPAIKPGTYEEYLWNHPEEVDRILRENGVDMEELERVLARGEGQLPVGRLSRASTD